MDLSPLTEHSLPEPLCLSGSARLLSPSGARCAAIAASGRLWILEINPSTPSASATPTSITVEDPKDPDSQIFAAWESERIGLSGFGGPLAVHDLREGRRFEGPDVRYYAATITPDGRYLFFFYHGSASIADIETGKVELAKDVGQIEHDGQTQAFFLDHPDSACVRPRSGGEFELYIGCYGIVLAHTFRSERGRRPERIYGKSHWMGDCVYDPTVMIASPGDPYVVVIDSCTAHALDFSRNQSFAYKEPGQEKAYGQVGFALPATGWDRVWVSTARGSWLWQPGGAVDALPDDIGEVVAIHPRRLLCLSEDGSVLKWYAVNPG